MEKQAKSFIPAMERAREKVIEDWLLNHNNTVDFKTKNHLISLKILNLIVLSLIALDLY